METTKQNCLCPNCGNDLSKELGVSQKADMVMYRDRGVGDVNYGDVIEYFCPSCGTRIPMELGKTLDKEFYE